MNLPNNKYTNLIKYLDEEISKTKSSKVNRVKVLEKKEATVNTQKLIQDSLEGIHSDVTQKILNKFSRGFNVNKFESLMRARLIDKHKKMQSYDRPYISVTELFNCMRKSYYIRQKYEIDVSKEYQFSYLYMINKVGDKVHDLIQNLYDHTEVEKTLVSERYKVKGRVDGIRDNFLLEYKTIDVDKFKNKYLPNHYNQGIIYAYILNKEYGYKINTITIVYVTRNLKKIIPFDLPIDDNKAIKFLEGGPILLDCISNNIVPEPVNADKEQCHWCQYKKYCEKDNKQTLKKKTNTKSVFKL